MITVRSIGFNSNDGESLTSISLKKRDFKNLDEAEGINHDVLVEETLCYKKWKPAIQKLKIKLSFKNLRPAINDDRNRGLLIGEVPDRIPSSITTPCPIILAACDDNQLDAAATKLQKAYKSYRTRRNLADCAVVVEELWWKALDFAALRRSSISFFDSDKSETAVSRWARARTRVAKLAKGLSKDEKAQQLVLRHWLEVIDPRHRYGHNLHLYYNAWFASRSSQPFFYWLDVGDGKEINLEICPRTLLQRQCIKYLGPKEREAYEVIVTEGKLIYRQSGKAVDTVDGTKWIFVLSASRSLYVGQKEKGLFQHSSFLAGGAAIAAGRLIAHAGLLQAVWSYSGHYRPTEENFLEFINFLEDQNVDLTNVEKCPMDDDIPPAKNKEERILECISGAQIFDKDEVGGGEVKTNAISNTNSSMNEEKVDSLMASEAKTEVEAAVCEATKPIICKLGGTRIGRVREYPTKLQLQALEHVNLSPRNMASPSFASCVPIPSPRPSPKILLSPTLAHMGLLQSSTLHLSDPN